MVTGAQDFGAWPGKRKNVFEKITIDDENVKRGWLSKFRRGWVDMVLAARLG